MKHLLAILVVCVSTVVLAQDGISTPDSVTPAIRAQLSHVKDLLNAQKDLMQANDVRYEQRFQAQEKATALALTALEKATRDADAAAKEAIEKAQTANEKRLDSVNEFRETLRDQADTFMRASEANAQFQSIIADINKIQERLNLREGEGEGKSAFWGYVIGFVGFLVALGSLYTLVGRFDNSRKEK